MKKLNILVLVPVLAGLGLIIGGIASGVSAVLYAGIAVLFGGSFLVALITTIVVVARSMRGSGSSANDNNAESDRDTVERINSTRGTRAREIETAEWQLKNAHKAYKNASNGDKVKGCIFVIMFIGCLIASMILFSLEYILPGGILFGCAFLIIIGAAIISSSAQRRSLSRRYNPADYIEKIGVVDRCGVASTTSVNGRVTKVVYSVSVKADGSCYDAYSTDSYEPGEKLIILVHKKGKTVKIKDTVISDGDGYDDYDDAPTLEADNIEQKRDSYSYADDRADFGGVDGGDDYDDIAENSVEPIDAPAAEGQTERDAVAGTENDKNAEPLQTAYPDKVDETVKKPNVGYKGIKRKK